MSSQRPPLNSGPAVSIIGCGWLGQPLAQKLISLGVHVCGTTTHPAKLKTLRELGIDASLLRLDPDGRSAETISNESLCRLFDSPQILFNVPPSGLQSAADHIQQLQSLFDRLPDESLKHFVFVSSTSVYGDLFGDELKATHGLVSELTPCKASKTNGQILFETERFLTELGAEQGFSLTIVRSGGQIGFGRHPGRFLSGRQNLRDPDHPVNLIHQVDLIESLAQILLRPSPEAGATRLFNAVGLSHPTRQEFYTASAVQLGLPAPEFSPQDPSRMPGKTILSQALRDWTEVEFQFDDLVTAVSERRL